MLHLYVVLITGFVFSPAAAFPAAAFPAAPQPASPQPATVEQSSGLPPDTERNITASACAAGWKLSNGTCKDVNECAHYNGRCSHICVNTPGSYQCQCPLYHRLLGDTTTCKMCYMEVAGENGNTGILESHGYPQPYLGQQDCQWKIKGKLLHVLHLKFKIDIEYSQCCSHGMLAIKPNAYNFLSTLHNIPDKICGFFDTLELYWDGDFTMQFNTSAANGHTGFRLQYSYVPLQKANIRDLITLKVSGGYLDHTNSC